MFGTFAITALLAVSALPKALADAIPSVPGPGVVYKVGGKCHIEWDGDKDSTTAWKNMAIELMTGDNFSMVHLTTVATGLDGTVAGKFDHTCPDVNPYSAIYFYQFSAAGTSNKQWTTRFAIAPASGVTVPPAQTNQPNTNAPIPWGTGALVDAASALPPPDFNNNTPMSVPPINNASSSSSTSVAPSITPTPTPTASSNSSPSSSGSSSRMVTVTTSNTPVAIPTGGVNGTSTPGSGNGAIGLDMKLWKTAVALGGSAMAFALLL